ncbi:hypothetical protein [Palleronia caenipelagi]|uniref:DUF4340 domain-containing protein n=1 Tax=Palleronia caenipelagi TaxID=2489174 RepID=A0A547PUC4_9RHOB|nr:hypothetical protein [Palleronia caenipelagi]TRD17742.1 hypothetical protein FEV53_12765 [Palleronia caenipelagi]
MAMMLTAFAAAAQGTVDLDDVQYLRIEDSDNGVSYLVPDDADLGRPAKGSYSLNGLAGEGTRQLQVIWDRRVAWVDTFDIAFEFMHVDWLRGHAVLTGQSVLDLSTIENETGIIGGRMEATVEGDGSNPRRSYLFMVGGKGYHVHGQNDRSNFLVDIIAARFATTVGTPWGDLDEEQTVSFRQVSFDIRDDLVVEDLSNDRGEVLLISDREELEQAAVLLILRYVEGENFPDQARTFYDQMVQLGFLVDTEKVTEKQIELSLLSDDGRDFQAYLTGATGGPSVGLLTPYVTENPAVWLAARRAYAAAVLALAAEAPK